MKTEIITIGDELLIGQVVDTNSAWMGQELNKIGFDVVRKITIGDEKHDLLDAFEAALSRVDVVLVTGGIGPTKDDITKKTLCEFFDTELVFDENELQRIEDMFKHRGMKINELTRTQAYVSRDCEVIPNTAGTAPVTWFERDGKVLVSMPGVPFEMKTIMKQEVLPRLQSRFAKDIHIMHRTFSVKNYSESALAAYIAEWEEALPAFCRLAYLPSPGVVRLRITGRLADSEQLESAMEDASVSLRALLGDAIFVDSDAPMGEFVGELLRKCGFTLATAESCTGGYIAHQITAVAGSSAYFKGGVVAYSNELKRRILGVSEATLAAFGAVSEEVAREMAEGMAAVAGADVAISTTGIAGPDGGSVEKPVGTVWIAVKVKEQIRVTGYRFGNQREANIQRTTSTALLTLAEMLQEHICGK